MEQRSHPYSAGPAPVSPPPAPRRRRRGWLHLFLLSTTIVTLLLAGGLWWEGPVTEEELDARVAGGFVRSTLLAGLPYALWVLAILGSHEMGHYLACRYYGIPVTLPFFIPSIPPLGTFGAVIRIRGPIPDRKALFDIAAAGPIAGIVVTVPALLFGLAAADPFVPQPGDGLLWRFGTPVLLDLLRNALLGDVSFRMNSLTAAGWVGLLVTSLNLFPVGQLDGGHAAYAISRRFHRTLTALTLVGLLALIVYQAVSLRILPAYLVWFAILLWMRDRHPPLLDESGQLGAGRKLVAALLLLIFVMCFIFIPVRLVEL